MVATPVQTVPASGLTTLARESNLGVHSTSGAAADAVQFSQALVEELLLLSA
jgi:hypothetical protein